MKELMQHLLDGGKLVDERGHTLDQVGNGSFRVSRDDDNGDHLEILTLSEEIVGYLAEHTVEKLETYEDGFYWVMCEESSMERRLWFCQNRNWFQISHKNVIPRSQNPHRVIERVEL